MDEVAADGVPILVPARMVNEFTYCPRLFYLEWVQAQFADNADTADGGYVHRYADSGGGAAPLPDEGELIEARSVSVSSERLGLSAKIDVVEGVGGAVRPVERKRGSPPANAERSWEPERVQLCVQGLLLRDAGYTCDSGDLYFAETRQRVHVEFDEHLVGRTHELLANLRRVAASEVVPEPLVDSPKCPRCSLVGICLPDETNAMTGRVARPLRRLMSRDSPRRPVYVTEPGAYVGRDKNRLEIKRHGELLGSARLIDVSQLCVYGNVQVSTQLIRELLSRDVFVGWFSYGGWFAGMATGLPSKNVELRRRQVVVAGQGGLAIAREIVRGKIKNCRTLLRRNSRVKQTDALDRLARLAGEANNAGSYATLLGLEGAAARTYFGVFDSMLVPPQRLPGATFSFSGRNRRPPLDAVNCLLSYAYALLVKDLTATCWMIGLDPYMGIYHKPRFGRPALALDLAEEFRPLIADSLVINLVNNGEIGKGDFVVRAGGVALTADGRRAVLSGYERRLEAEIKHPTFGYRISYRRVLDVQARMFAALLLNEIPSYLSFTTR